MPNRATAMYANTAAAAQGTCAASACAAMNCIILVLDVSLLASIFVLLITLPVFTGDRITVQRSSVCGLSAA